MKFETFGKKFSASYLKYLQNYSLQKRWILGCIAGLVFENPSAVNVLRSSNHCTTMQNRTFMLLFQHSAKDKVGKDDPL